MPRSHGSATSLTVASTGSCRTAVRNEELRSKPFGVARQRGGKVEAKAVDVADLDPVAQRIHHHLQHARMGEVDRAAAAGEVVVVARVFLVEPVIGRVVDAAETSASGRDGCPRRCGYRPRRASPRCRRRAAAPPWCGTRRAHCPAHSAAPARRTPACCSPSSSQASARPAPGRRSARGSAAIRWW